MTARGNDYDNTSAPTTADLGVVSRIDPEEGELAVDFDGREIELEHSAARGHSAILVGTAILAPISDIGLIGAPRSAPEPSTAPERYARSARAAV
jgi:hypothetical protein